jgi:hypothetical protein
MKTRKFPGFLVYGRVRLMANGSAYVFNMSLNTLTLIVNNSDVLTVNPLSNTAPYNTLGTAQTVVRTGGVTNPPGQFGDHNTFSWFYSGDSTPRSLPDVHAPSSYDLESDIQIYVFKNSVMLRYGDNATYFSSAGAATA